MQFLIILSVFLTFLTLFSFRFYNSKFKTQNLELQFIPLHPKPLLDYFVAMRRKSGIVAPALHKSYVR